jgi:ABC-type nitrate/sulfonate/bicarbonate transport system substrate-binding protein
MAWDFNDISRRNVIQGIGAGTVVAMAPMQVALAQGKTTLTFFTAYEILLEQMHELNAIAGGHMAKEGLDIKMIPGKGTSLAIQQVVADKAQVSRVGALDLIKAAASQKVSLLSVGVSLQEGIFSVVSLNSNPVKSPKEMKGKRIGVASIGGGTENMLDLMLVSAGVKGADVTRQAVGSSPGNIELVKQGRLDAFFTTVDGAMTLRRNGEPALIWSADLYAPMPGGAIIMRREYAEKERSTVIAFMRAMYASAQELLVADPAMIIERVSKAFDISAPKDPEFRAHALTIYNYMALTYGRSNLLRNVPEVWKNAVQQISSAGLAKLDAPESIYSNEYIDAAIKS